MMEIFVLMITSCLKEMYQTNQKIKKVFQHQLVRRCTSGTVLNEEESSSVHSISILPLHTPFRSVTLEQVKGRFRQLF